MKDNQSKEIKESQVTISLIGRVVNNMKRDDFNHRCLTLDYSSVVDEMEEIYNKEQSKSNPI